MCLTTRPPILGLNRLKAHAGASQTMDEIQIELNELRKLKKQNINAAKVSGNVRKLFLTLNNYIIQLSDVLAKDGKSGAM